MRIELIINYKLCGKDNMFKYDIHLELWNSEKNFQNP